MAAFVVHVGMSPTEYKSLTLLEREAIQQEHNRAMRKQRKG